MSDIPIGYCQCGCSQKTNLHTNNWKGHWVKGEPRQYIFGHSERKTNFKEWFWSNVAVLSPDECWLWNGTRTKLGYGVMNHNGKILYAHRVAYEFTNGTLPKDLLACHRCDNPPCCNPFHIFAGTHKDNSQDMRRKGRDRNQFPKKT